MELQKTGIVKPGWNFNLIRKHVLGWSLFMLYEISFVWFSTGKIFSLKSYVLYYTLNIALFYTNASCLNHVFRKSRPYLMTIMVFGAELVVYLTIKYTLDHFVTKTHSYVLNRFMPFDQFLVVDIYRGVYFIAFSTLYWAILRMIILDKQTARSEQSRLMTLMANTELEKDLSEVNNAYLRHQINPHFLFNALTFVHNTVYGVSESAAKCVMLLTDITHYSFEETDSDGKRPLIDEIEQISNLIDLHRLRYSYNLWLDFEIKGEIGEAVIIPIILITLVENIFKHGNLMDKNYPGKVLIAIDGQKKLTLECWNLKSQVPVHKRIKTIGLINVFKRLDYSYNGRYKLDISEDEDSYGLNLSIQL